MPVAGIVAEFDPFHLGHQYLINELRHRLGQDTPVVVVLSGSFTQRGGAAICPPVARAEMALRGGADLVLELPLPFATASAETFARGGVEALLSTGVVDTLCFGSETGEESTLRRMAAALEGKDFPQALKVFVAQGLPFAAARQQALEQVLGGKLPQGANDLLATEYLRFWPADRPALAIPRRGGDHGGSQSASRVRQLLLAGEWRQAAQLLPQSSLEILDREFRQGRCPGSLQWAERGVLYRLRTMTEADFAAIADCTEGLEHRLVRSATQAGSLEEFYALAKSKRYAHARIRRIVLRAFLGMTGLPEQVPYLRVLGANVRGLELLREMKTRSTLPVITKPAHGRNLEGEAGALFAQARRADDLWGLCLERPIPSGWSWSQGPVLLKD